MYFTLDFIGFSRSAVFSLQLVNFRWNIQYPAAEEDTVLPYTINVGYQNDKLFLLRHPSLEPPPQPAPEPPPALLQAAGQAPRQPGVHQTPSEEPHSLREEPPSPSPQGCMGGNHAGAGESK